MLQVTLGIYESIERIAPRFDFIFGRSVHLTGMGTSDIFVQHIMLFVKGVHLENVSLAQWTSFAATAVQCRRLQMVTFQFGEVELATSMVRTHWESVLRPLHVEGKLNITYRTVDGDGHIYTFTLVVGA